MANDVKTGIALSVTGNDTFIRDLNDVTKAVEGYKEATAKAKAETKEFDAQIEQIEMIGNVVSTLLEVNAAIIAATNETAEHGDAVAKAAQQVGFASEAYQEWDFILERSGSSMSKARNAIENLTKASRNASDKQAAAFEELGLSMETVRSMQPEALFAAVIAGLQGVEDMGERSALANTLLGSSYRQLGTLLSSTEGDVESLRQQAHRLGLVMDEDTIAAAEAYQDSLDNLQGKINGIKTSLTSGLLEPLAETREGLVALADQVDWDALGQALTALYAPATSFLNDFLIPVAGLSLVGVTGMLSAFNAVLEETGKILRGEESVGEGLDNLWGHGDWNLGTPEQVLSEYQNLAAQAEITANAFNDLYAASTAGLVPEADAVAVESVTQAVSAYGEALQAQVGDAENAAEANAWLAEQLSKLQAAYTQDALSQEGTGFGDAEKRQEVANALAAIAQQYMELANQNPAAAAAEDATAAAETIGEAQQTVASGAAEMLDTFETGVGEISTEFAEGVDEMSTAAAESMQNVNDVMAANSAILSANAGVWGQDMMISFANGIILGYNDYVLQAVNSVAAGIEERLGFSEPELGPLSRFHTFAPDMMKLFAQGVRDYAPLVHDAVSEAFDLAPYMAYSPGGAAAGRSVTLEPGSVVIYGSEGQSADELYDVFSSRLAQAIDEEGAVFG